MNAKEQTKEHIRNVVSKIEVVKEALSVRASCHDASKLQEPEVSTFDIYTEKLKGSTYGSREYNQFLEDMKPALDHHYANNRHHPEHFNDGVDGMNLVDLVEMFCDWVAATERHEDGDIYKSIELNKCRFGINDQLCKIFKNTALLIFGKEPEDM